MLIIRTSIIPQAFSLHKSFSYKKEATATTKDYRKKGTAAQIINRESSFVRSGNTDRDYGTLRNLGLSGYNWAITAPYQVDHDTISYTGYRLGFDADTTNTAGGPGPRWNGFPIRCLAY